jgi:hypothetical protein
MVGRSDEFEVPLDVLARYVGTYDSTRFPGRTVVSLQGNQLMINTTGAGNIPLVAHGPNSFTMEGTGIEFVKDAGGAVIALLQHWAEGDRYEPRHK